MNHGNTSRGPMENSVCLPSLSVSQPVFPLAGRKNAMFWTIRLSLMRLTTQVNQLDLDPGVLGKSRFVSRTFHTLPGQCLAVQCHHKKIGQAR